MSRYKLTSPDMEDVPAFDDLGKAVMAYTRLVTAGVPAVLTDEDTLRGMPNVVAEYEGRPNHQPGAALPVAYDETELHWTEASWYAKGFIACAGALSPFDPQSDPGEFADWYIAQAEYPNIGQAWSVWTEQRRKETGR